MPIFTDGLPTRRNTFLDEYSAGLGEALSTTAEDTLIRSPTASVYRAGELFLESGTLGGERISKEDAKQKVDSLGLKLEIPDVGIRKDALDILIERKQDEVRRQDIMARSPQGFGAGVAKFATVFGASILDPINLASAFIPIVGEARYAQLLASAGTTGARVLPRALAGAAEGLVGAAMVEPIVYGAAKYEQADYSMLDSALNVAFGGVFGAGLHVLGGTGADLYRGWKGQPDPFNRFQGLSVDQIKQVNEVDSMLRMGINDPESLLDIISSYPPEVIRASGIMDQGDMNLGTEGSMRTSPGTIFGEDTQIKIGDQYSNGRWAVVDLNDLEATMTKADNQWRDRTRLASDVQIRNIANNPDFDLLQWSPIMDFGAPTLSNDGLVIGGNGRVMGISSSYDIGKSGPYQEKMNAALEKFGIDPAAISGMSKPMLVRILRDPVDIKKAAIASNEGGSARMSALEQAGVDAQRLGDFRGFDIPENGDLNTAANRGAIRQWVGRFPVNQQAELVTAEGFLSPQGLLRLRNAILHRAYGDSPILKALIEGTDEASTRLSNALIRVAGTIADARAAIARGELHSLDISQELQDAVGLLKDYRSKGMTFERFMSQGDLAREPIDPVTLQILRYLDDNLARPRSVAALVQSYYDQLKIEGNPNQGDMFGGEPPTKQDILDRALADVEADESAAAVINRLDAATRQAAMSTAVSQLADGRGVEVVSLIETDPSIGTATQDSLRAAAMRASSVGNSLSGDVGAAAGVEARSSSPKSTGLSEAEAAADAALNQAKETLKQGADAFKYSRDNALTNPQQVEIDFQNRVESDFDALAKDYSELPDSMGGRILDVDVARELSPAYLADRTLAAAVHEPASSFIKKLFAKFLASPTPEGKDNLVIFSGGGAGSGKTSGLRLLGAVGERAEFIYDTTLSKFDSGLSKIQEALDAGRDVVIAFTYRDPVEAFINGALPRAINQERKFGTGRTVPLTEYARAHRDARATVERLAKHFENDDRVSIIAIDNSRGVDGAILTTLDQLPVVKYDDIPGTIHEHITQEHQAGNVSDAIYTGFTGNRPERAGQAAGPGNGQEPQSVRERQNANPVKASELTEAIRASFGKSTEALLDASRVKIVDSPKDIPGGPHPDDVKAATAPDGTVYVVARNVSPEEAAGIMLHEVGVHVGLKRILGDVAYQRLLDEIQRRVAKGEKAYTEAAAKVPTDTDPAHVPEEILAYLVQKFPKLQIVQRTIAAVRAWAYRNFRFAQERLKLTDADIRALAVSSLHAVARADRMGMEGFREASLFSRLGEMVSDLKPRYARSGDSGADVNAEMKQFDEAIKRADLYAAAVRAAADRINDDVAARSAMAAATKGSLNATEIDELLAALRAQNTAVRNRLRSYRDSIQAGDIADELQPEAMQAADELANNLKMAAVIQKRNAALNLAARTKAFSFVMSQFQGNEAEGVRALLAGSEFRRRGARLSVDAEQKGFQGEWMGGIIADMEREGLWKLFLSETMSRETAKALFIMRTPGADYTGIPKEAQRMAEIISRYQEDARSTQNRFGAWIRDMKGYIVRQSHDMFRIRDAGYPAWRAYVLPRVDLDRTFFRRGVDDVEAGLQAMWQNFAAGLHMQFDPEEELTEAFSGMSMAKKQSQSRVIYFKDADSWFDYNEQFGTQRFAEAVLNGLSNASRAAALMKVLGTNPEATLTRLMDQVEDSLVTDPLARAKFHEERGSIMNLFAHVNGAANIPANHMAAQIGSGLRAWQSMSKLGGAVISSVTDIPVYASEARFQGRSLLSGISDAIGGLMHGRGSVEQKQILSSLGVFFDSMTHGVARRFDAEDNIAGRSSKLMQQFFKWNGLTWWTETLRSSAALTLSHLMAGNVEISWGKLSPDLQNMLSLYNIDEGKWDLVRMGATQEADGRSYLTPEGTRTIPQQALENYIQGVGRTVSETSVQNLRDDLAASLRNLYIDRAHYAVIEPNARTKAFWLRGTQPGTMWGEISRMIGQFKSFPTAMIQKVWGREIYGRGYDSLGQYLKNGKGDMLGMVHLMLWLTLFGYGAMSIKDMLKGRTPRDPLSPAAWTAAFLQGGGAGIYGDFIFGEMRNRFGGGALNTLAGPVIGTAEDILDLYGRIKAGDDAAAKAFRVALNNTPFLNMFYTRMALDYLIFYHVQEQLNPGYLRRMERRIEKENQQTFLIRPSEVAR